MEDVDEKAHTATIQAQGTDRRGQGSAKATIFSSVSDAGNGASHVEVVTDYKITGRLARFGRGGMIEDISNRLLTEFCAVVAGVADRGQCPGGGGGGGGGARWIPRLSRRRVRAPRVRRLRRPSEASEASTEKTAVRCGWGGLGRRQTSRRAPQRSGRGLGHRRGMARTAQSAN